LSNWELFKRYYSDLFDTSLELVDYLAVYDILRLCAYGYSNYKIERYTKIELSYIEDTLLTYYDFCGWACDLDFSPIALYNRSKGNFIYYEQEIRMICDKINKRLLKRTFDISKRFNDIKKEVDEFYGRN